MYLDAQNQFSNAQAVTSTAISENVIDLCAGVTTTPPNLTTDLGIGEPVWLVIQTETACTDSGSDATVTFSLESDDNVGLSSATVHYTSGAVPFATYSPVGTRVVATRLPSGNYQRYLGVRYTVASGPLTAGKFDAFLTKDIAAYTSYADGFSIMA